MGWKKRLRRAKRLHRPSLKNWECDGLYEIFPAYVDSIVSKPAAQQFHTFLLQDDGTLFDGCRGSTTGTTTSNGSSSNRNSNSNGNSNIGSSNGSKNNNNGGRGGPHEDTMTRVNVPVVTDAQHLTVEEFATRYETDTPVVIRNIPAGYDGGQRSAAPWGAVRHWTLQSLNDPLNRMRHRTFKCGEDDDGKSIKVKLKYFLQYMLANRDDSPLYVFDTSFEDDDIAADCILSQYAVPSYFKDDLFQYCSESRRPPYRWFLLGPERSGTTVHIDPLATAAWNTLLVGTKRWVLFPPHVPKHVVKGRDVVRDDEDDEAAHYFMFLLPRIKRRAASLRHHDDYGSFACYEFTQHAGETVFIPHGWWHAVLNLTHTVGITQNFCSRQNFEAVWRKTRSGRKRLAWKWLCQLDEHHPDLADRARHMNKADGFRMKYDPAEIKRREVEDRRRKLQRVV